MLLFQDEVESKNTEVSPGPLGSIVIRKILLGAELLSFPMVNTILAIVGFLSVFTFTLLHDRKVYGSSWFGAFVRNLMTLILFLLSFMAVIMVLIAPVFNWL